MVAIRMQNYSTVKNVLRSFGGTVEVPEPTLGSHGKFTVPFSRPIVFPKALVEKYITDYEEVIPELKMT